MKSQYYLIVCLVIMSISCHSTGNVKVMENSADSVKSLVVSTSQSKEHELKGVLILKTDSAYLEKMSYSIWNLDKSPYAKIESIGDSEPSSNKLKNKILAYYPEYYIVHFNAYIFSDSLYSVKIGTDEKLIKKGVYMEYLSWPNYVLRFFATTTKANPLRAEPKLSSEIIPNLNYSELNFRCVEISGDWVKVSCNKECEGCPNGKQITGWIRWKEKGRIILKQYYTC